MAFHVPTTGRNTTDPRLGTTDAAGNNGAFVIGSPEPGWRLSIICSDGLGWEHVSVRAEDDPIFRRRSYRSRVPTWREMVAVKNVCWDSEDVVMQLHPRASAYVNTHPHVLHLWRPIAPVAAIPEPPAILVGIVR